MSKIKTTLLLCALIIVGAFLRFYNLNWGAPYYFHPDERNIASSVSQLHFPLQMNPHFFAYGSFPIYIIYSLGLVWNLLSSFQTFNFVVPLEQAILASRAISALLSTLLIPLLYFVGKTLKDKTTGLLAAAFGTFSIGLIQFAHFGTFEIWTTFLSTLLFYICLKILKEYSIGKIIIAGIICGLLLATKVSNFPLLFIPVLTVTSFALPVILKSSSIKNDEGSRFFATLRMTNAKFVAVLFNLKYKNILKNFFFLFLAFFITFFITSPFVFSDFSSFLSSINYESNVALGALPVFYTGEFFNTIPVIFHLVKIYPFILNPLVTIIFIPSFLYLGYTAIKRKSFPCYILSAIYLILFLPHAFLFAKWTRYVIPTLPFIYVIISMFLADIFKKSKTKLYYKYTGIFVVAYITVLFAFSYFITSFVKPDTRIAAALWARNNVPLSAAILSEVYDLGIVPFNSNFPNITLFNFYDLDSGSETEENLNQTLANTDYIILPSQRIMKTRLTNEKQFPIGHGFYKSLFEEKLGFKKMYETPCDIFCKITYLNSDIFSYEQTANVFDRPTVFIFKKQ